ncbi:uncharacterized protein LOC126971565 isoform X2 [Leptidea sinapis]|uniref:uncharacterized protein LOC126971565 isoform X2 n=1 Tax=Leptidea sinapis TaxID=189913 RepID=UPI0021C3CA61|nr:uncharacterized protein LOC126971565 isoform X2 [Leptidea sinapis]
MKRRSDIILAKALKLKKYESEANMRENLAREAKENECPNLSFTYAVPEEKTRNEPITDDTNQSPEYPSHRSKPISDQNDDVDLQQQREWIDDDCSVIEDSPQREMPFLKLNQENNQVKTMFLSTYCMAVASTAGHFQCKPNALINPDT